MRTSSLLRLDAICTAVWGLRAFMEGDLLHTFGLAGVAATCWMAATELASFRH